MIFLGSNVLDQLFQVFKVSEFGVIIKKSLEFGLGGRVRFTKYLDGLGVILLFWVPFFLVSKGDLIVDCRETVRSFGHATHNGIRTN